MDKKKFQAYEAVRQSGLTNMFMISQVISLSGNVLTRGDCKDIMQNYDKYSELYK